jgi:hypothetical protein
VVDVLRYRTIYTNLVATRQRYEQLSGSPDLERATEEEDWVEMCDKLLSTWVLEAFDQEEFAVRLNQQEGGDEMQIAYAKKAWGENVWEDVHVVIMSEFGRRAEDRHESGTEETKGLWTVLKRELELMQPLTLQLERHLIRRESWDSRLPGFLDDEFAVERIFNITNVRNLWFCTELRHVAGDRAQDEKRTVNERLMYERIISHMQKATLDDLAKIRDRLDLAPSDGDHPDLTTIQREFKYQYLNSIDHPPLATAFVEIFRSELSQH